MPGTTKIWKPRSVFIGPYYTPPYSTRLRGRGHLAQSYPSLGALPPALSQIHSQQPLEWLHHKCWGPRNVWSAQHRSNAGEPPTSMGCSRLHNGGQPPTKVRDVRYFPLVLEAEGPNRSASRWRSFLKPETLTGGSGPTWLLTVLLGAKVSIRLSPSLKKTRETLSRTNVGGGKLELIPLPQALLQHSPTDTAWGPAFPVSVSSVTSDLQ